MNQNETIEKTSSKLLSEPYTSITNFQSKMRNNIQRQQFLKIKKAQHFNGHLVTEPTGLPPSSQREYFKYSDKKYGRFVLRDYDHMYSKRLKQHRNTVLITDNQIFIGKDSKLYYNAYITENTAQKAAKIIGSPPNQCTHFYVQDCQIPMEKVQLFLKCLAKQPPNFTESPKYYEGTGYNQNLKSFPDIPIFKRWQIYTIPKIPDIEIQTNEKDEVVRLRYIIYQQRCISQKYYRLCELVISYQNYQWVIKYPQGVKPNYKLEELIKQYCVDQPIQKLRVQQLKDLIKKKLGEQ